jgi:hypothetical protein
MFTINHAAADEVVAAEEGEFQLHSWRYCVV